MPTFLRYLAIATALFLFASPLKAEQVTTKLGDLTLNGNLSLADGKSFKDGVILITHGTLAHGEMDTIKNLQAVLVERGFNTLALNLSLGVSKRVGMYDCKVPHTHKHTDALDEIAAWIGWLKSKGTTSITLFGHSRGGNQTAWFMAERPDQAVQSVVLLAPATWNAEKASKGYAKNHNAPLSKPMGKAKALVAKGQGKTMIKGYGFIYCPLTEASAESFLSYYTPDNRFHTPNLLGKIKAPMLVIAGSADTVVTGLSEAVGPMAEKSKNLSFTLVDEADHFFLDLFAEDVADAMEEFFAQ